MATSLFNYTFSSVAHAQSTGTNINVLEDAFVKAENVTKNYGKETIVVSDGDPAVDSFLKFDLASVNNKTINSAKLKISPLLTRKVNKVIKIVPSSNWSETTLNWSNKPAAGVVIGTINTQVVENIPFEITLDASKINAYAGSKFSIVIEDVNNGYQLRFASKETNPNSIQLILENGGTATPAPTPTKIPTPNPTPTKVVTPTPTPTKVPTPNPTPTKVVTPTPTPTNTPTPNPTPVITPPINPGNGIWISQAEIKALPTPPDSKAWNSLKAAADYTVTNPDIENQDSNANVYTVAKALVYVKTGETKYRDEVVAVLRKVATWPKYGDRALALGREIGAYAIAADIINLKSVDSQLDTQLKTRLGQLRTEYTNGGPTSLIDCHEKRPNNWGLHCGASRIAIDLYIGDKADLQRAANVFRGWTGETSYYNGFDFGDLSWQCNPSNPVGVNPRNCIKNGMNIGGVPADDQRRCGGFGTPPCVTGYYWGAMEGSIAMATMLQRAGYSDVWNWGDKALFRIAERSDVWEKTYWKEGDHYWAEGDDVWQPWVVNRAYGTNFPTNSVNAGNPGKNMSWADWTHAK